MNLIFCDEIFGVNKTLKFWLPCWCPKVGHQGGRSIHFLLKMSNTCSPTMYMCVSLLNEIFLHFKIWPRCVYNSIRILESKSAFYCF